MTVCIRDRDRCRLCFTLIPRDRSVLFSSGCCQKSYHLFQQIHRRKLPRKPSNRFQTKLSHRTVCFHDLIRRYLRTEMTSTQDCSNVICANCSMILLDIEQCAKYLRKTINHLKMKFNRSNRLFTSSLAVKFQKKDTSNMKIEQLPMLNSDDDDDEFDDVDDEEESDNEPEDLPPTAAATTAAPNRSKGLRIASPTSSNGDSILNIPAISSSKTNKNNDPCNDADEDDDEDDEDEDGENSGNPHRSQSSHNHTSAGLHSSDPSSLLANNAVDETNPALLQLRFVHMMANLAAASNPTSGNNPESMMAALANMQRNAFMKMMSDPMAAAQMAAAAASASSSEIKANFSPTSSNNKQASSGRKRKSTPEKRVIANHRIGANNGHTSPNDEHESTKNSVDLTDQLFELNRKDQRRASRILSSNDVQNLVINHRGENGSPVRAGQPYPHQLQLDDDLKESVTPNESSHSLSPSLPRRPATSKRPRLSVVGGQYEYRLTQNHHPTGNASQTTAHLLSPTDDPNAANHQRQQKKLETRPCAECGKVLFSDKTHLLHGQTHARNEKQCWICGINDDDIKKHILTEHGNQKFTNAGFKCQHCDRAFPVFADLEAHMKEHSKKKPFECPICHKRFGQQGNLSCHLRIHSGVKPFTCASCGKAFRHSNSLRRHARTVHSATRGLSSSSNSFLPDTTMSFTDDYKHEAFDDEPSAPMIPSDDSSSSTGGIPSPSVSNVPLDSDSPEQLETN